MQNSTIGIYTRKAFLCNNYYGIVLSIYQSIAKSIYNLFARSLNPTDGDLNALANILHDRSRGSAVWSHFFRVSLKHLSAFSWLDILIESNVVAIRPNSNPISYHLARALQTICHTCAKSLTVRGRLIYNGQRIKSEE